MNIKTIKQIGLEFECFMLDSQGFYDETNEIPINREYILKGINKKKFGMKDLSIGTDGSISADDDISYTMKTENGVEIPHSQFACSLFNLEIKSRWDYNEEFFNKLERYAQFMFKYFGQNDSCGNHIHLSFKEEMLGFACFTFKKYWDMIITSYKEKFINSEYYDRIKYANRFKCGFCNPQYDYRNIILIINKNEDAERMKAINLLSYEKHGTVEFRMMPYAEDWNEYIDQIKWLIETVETILTGTYANNEIELSFLKRPDNPVIESINM